MTPPTRPRRNLLILHLESVSWQTLRAFPEAFPHLTALLREARSFRWHFSSATSTQMAVAAVLHGNDREMDAAPVVAPPVGRRPSLFSQLEEAGYRAAFLCATHYPAKPMLELLAASLPPPWSTNDFGALLARFEALVQAPPFAIYAWNLVPHIVADLALAPYARSLEDLVAGGCAVADTLVGALLEILRRHDLLEATTVVAFGDHGDDYWTHGFKGGLLHGLEPYSALVHTPLAIRDPALPPGEDERLASSVDIAPTCLDLLGLPAGPRTAGAGASLRGASERTVAFAQNYTASQPDTDWRDVRRAFAALDRAHCLMVTGRGLALFNHRLDPGCQTNLLHHFTLTPEGGLAALRPADEPHAHFETVRHLWRGGALDERFRALRQALRSEVEAKNAEAAARAATPPSLLGLEAFDRIDRTGRDRFFNRPETGDRLRRAETGRGKRRSRLRRWLGGRR